jgi:hypothetical protein
MVAMTNTFDVLIAAYRSIEHREGVIRSWSRLNVSVAHFTTPGELAAVANRDPEVLIELAQLAVINEDAFITLCFVLRGGLFAIVNKFAPLRREDVAQDALALLARRVKAYQTPRESWTSAQQKWPAGWLLKSSKSKTVRIAQRQDRSSNLCDSMVEIGTQLSLPITDVVGVNTESESLLREAVLDGIISVSDAQVLWGHFCKGEPVAVAARRAGWTSPRNNIRDSRVERARLNGCVAQLRNSYGCEVAA